MKLLYGVQGTGNGHIGRARAMAAAFSKQNVQVDFLFSGRAANAYFSMDDFGRYQTRRGLTFYTEQGRINLVKTVSHNNPLQFLREIRQLDLRGYDLVLNDFEPISAWAAKKQQIPSIGISHQNAFRFDVPKVGMNAMDRLVMKHFAPTNHHLGLHWYHFNQPILPPIVHSKSGMDVRTEPLILVYLPFEDLHAIRQLLLRIKNQRFVCYHPEQKVAEEQDNLSLQPLSHENFQTDLHRCQGVIANGGFELPSEALSLGKKLLLKPLQGQFEQQSNVKTLEQLGLCHSMQALDAQTIIGWLSTKAQEPVRYPKVADAIVDWVLQGNWDNHQPLWDSLWQQVEFPSTVKI
ncbi:MAG: glycosyltransferase [Alkalimonas sp.]|nr:glycosyltransferase [Alkalimonas sp.]